MFSSDLSLSKILAEDNSGLKLEYAGNDIEVVYAAFRLVLPLLERAASYLFGVFEQLLFGYGNGYTVG